MVREPGVSRIRIDKWLWAARFYKTRPLAASAVSGGKVHLNGYRVKPGAAVKYGDMLTITRGSESLIISIEQLATQRGPASIAQQMYTETEQSRLMRQQAREQRRLLVAPVMPPARRPDKKQRRHIIRFQRQSEQQ